MSKINDLVEKIGTDKVMHFLVGALFVAFGFQISMLFGFISIPLIMGLELYKEYRMDNFVDWKDVLVTFLGTVFSVVVSFVIYYLK